VCLFARVRECEIESEQESEHVRAREREREERQRTAKWFWSLYTSIAPKNITSIGPQSGFGRNIIRRNIAY